MFKKLAPVAVLLAVLTSSAFAGVGLKMTPLDDQTVSVQLATSGATRGDALTSAREQAVIAAAGRLLLDGVLLRADNLLEKYLRTYANQFVRAVEVHDETFSGGLNVLTTRVFVDSESLLKDLQEKRFLYTPAYKPMVAVFLSEDLEGAAMSQEVARPLLQNALELSGLKAYDGAISTPPTNVDIASDKDLLAEGIIATERRNVEIIVTGKTTTSLREERKVYYDNFYFYDCTMTVQMIRVDTGEVLQEVVAEGSASDRDRAESIRLSIERAAAQVARSLEEKYDSFWPRVVQSNSDYEVLLTGVNEELVRIVKQHLEQVGFGTEIGLRKQFDGCAVLTIKTEAGRDALIQAIRGCSYPTLTIIREVGKDKLEVQVAG
jgi:hypothetical protein